MLGEKGAQRVTFISRRLTPSEEKKRQRVGVPSICLGVEKFRHFNERKMKIKTNRNVLRWLYEKIG